MAQIKLDPKAMGLQLKTPAVQARLDAEARRISASAGEGTDVRKDTGRNRARAAVISFEGKKSADALKRAARL